MGEGALPEYMEPIETSRNNIAGRGIAALLTAIVAGELGNGEVICSDDLSECSATAPPQALTFNLLGTLGLVEKGPRIGVFVETHRALNFARQLSALLTPRKSLVPRIMATILYVEPALAALAATNASEEDAYALGRTLEELARGEAADLSGGVCDLPLHRLMGRMSGRPEFARMIEAAWGYLDRFRRQLAVEFIRDQGAVLADWGRVQAAIGARDPTAAYEQTQSHIERWIGVNVAVLRGMR